MHLSQSLIQRIHSSIRRCLPSLKIAISVPSSAKTENLHRPKTTLLDSSDLSNLKAMEIWPGEESMSITIPSSMDSGQAVKLIRRVLECSRHRCSNFNAVASEVSVMALELKSFQ